MITSRPGIIWCRAARRADTTVRRRGQDRVLVLEPLEERFLLAAPHPLNLANLNGVNGFRLDGIDQGDYSGWSVREAGDVNGDGFDDLIVGAPNADPGGDSFAGESYVVFGKSSFASSLNLAVLDGANGFRIDGIDTNDTAGLSVSSAGDVNGDGFADLIVGARSADPGGKSGAGESYVVFGKASFAASLNLSTLNGTNGFRIDGIDADDASGRAVSSAGDVNGDGFDDVIVGAPLADPAGKSGAGESYVVFGKATFTASMSLSDLNGTNGFRIDAIDASDGSGRAVSSAGDVNGDGFGDVIVGAPYADPAGKSGAGESYVIFGRTSFASSLSLSALNGTNGFRIDGADVGNESGYSVSSAGDVNGDGFDDLIIGAPRANSYGGASYVVFGKASFAASMSLSALDGTSGFRASGLTGQSGTSVSSAGDMDGDGFDDLIIGAPFADRSYVIFGQASFSSNLNLSNTNGTNGFRIDGIGSDDRSGFSVSFAGDVNGDGFDDVIVAAPLADALGDQNAGESYVIFGGNFTNSVTHAGSLLHNSLTGTVGGDVMNGGRGNDTLKGSGGADVLRGAQGNDTLGISDLTFKRIDGGTGSDTLRFDVSGMHLDLAAIPDNRITGIERIQITSLALGTNTLTLDVTEVLNISGESNTLVVLGDETDRLDFGGGWRRVGSKLVGGSLYKVFAQGEATLEVSAAVDTPPVTSFSLAAVASGNGSEGFVLEGMDPFDGSGRSASSAGDVNGDGFDDVIVGARGAQSAAGESYVIFGKASFGSSLSLAALDGSNGFRIAGIDAVDYSSQSVSSAGDVNGDGFDDLIVGAPNADAGGDSAAGESYVIFGKASFGSSVSLADLNGSNGFRIDGIDVGDYSGRSVSSAGDVNGDGFDDLIVGAPGADPGGDSAAGESYVIFGKASFGSSLSLADLNGSNGFRIDGIDASDYSGHSVSSAGDVNGDGFDDLIVGAPGADPGGDSASGESYVIFGRASFGSSLSLADLDSSNGFRIDGIDAGDYSGRSVSSAGDVNGDGFEDLMVGAPYADPGGQSAAGESYVIFGRASFGPSVSLGALNGSNGFRMDGIDANDEAGHSVRSAGDVNGDGFDDLIVAAPGADPDGDSGAGESYVIFGKASFGLSVSLAALNGSNGFRIDGIDTFDSSSYSVGSAGDVNGDGFDDLIVGALGADLGGNSDAGESYVIFGGDFNAVVTHLGSSGTSSLLGDGNANVMIGGRGNDALVGGGSQDALRGGQGNDVLAISDLMFRRIVGGSGSDTLRLDGSGIHLDLTAVRDARVAGIEQVDIRGNGSNSLSLDLREVLNISDESNTLLVRRDEDDIVQMGAGWTAAGTELIGGATYEVFTQGNATLKLLRLVSSLSLSLLATGDGSGGFVLQGIDPGDQTGIAVSSAGDVNGDGFIDIIVGASEADPAGDMGAGETYVVFGGPSGFPATLSMGALNGSNGFRLDGINSGDGSGISVSSAGDLNGDGLADLLIGTRGADVGAAVDAGASYVVFGSAVGFPAAWSLAALNGSNGFRVHGIDSMDLAGASVSSAGDVNGDGLDDLLIGAFRADPGGKSAAGESYVVFGRMGGFGPSLSLAALDGMNGFRIDGIQMDDFSGASVSSAGDVNGDGFDDLVIGAYGADQPLLGGLESSGQSYLVFGRSSFASSVSLAALDGSNGFRLDGVATQDRSGRSVRSAGDVNGDGFGDVIIGAPGANPSAGSADAGISYVVFGRAGGFAPVLSLQALTGTDGFQIQGMDAMDHSGTSVSSAGDFNGDGIDDLLIGAALAAPGGMDAAGETYVLFGKTSGFSASFKLSDLDATNGFRLDGIRVGDASGSSVSSAGDVNGDGFDDLVIGSPLADPISGADAGESYVVFGGDWTGSVTHRGDATDNMLLGDVNANVIVGGDGDDILVGGGNEDVLLGGHGNDVLAASDTAFRRASGGAGFDTLRVDGSGIMLDLTLIPDGRIRGMETIDLRGSGSNTLKLNVLEVLNLSDTSNTLIVDRNADDMVEIGAGWTPAGTELIKGRSFLVFTQGHATLKLRDLAPPAVTLSLADSPLTEHGGIATVTAELSSLSDQDVTVVLTYGGSAANGTDYTASASSLLIAAGTTSASLTLNAVDDAVVETTETVVVAVDSVTNGTVSGTQQVTAVIHDDDTPGIRVTPSTGLVTTESGGNATFTIVLDTVPAADVTIQLASTDPTEGTVSPASLTFTPASALTPQIVTVTGVDDSIDDGTIAYTITTAGATSSDPAYHGIDAADVALTNEGNDDVAPRIVATQSLRDAANKKAIAILVTFDESVTGAEGLANYRIARVGPVPKPVALRGASYDPLTRTVRLTPAKSIATKKLGNYSLTVNSVGTLADLAGHSLDGDRDGAAGGNFVRVLSQEGVIAASLSALDALLQRRKLSRSLPWEA